MVTIKKENVVWIDVDDTLVMWPDNPFQPQFKDSSAPVKAIDPTYMPFDNYGETVYLKPHDKNIQLLKSYKERGYLVIVHSANGYQWANEVVSKLLLRQYIDFVMTKAMKYVDDLPAHEWMQRVYINEAGINE